VNASPSTNPEPKAPLKNKNLKLTSTNNSKILLGVCSRIAKYLDIDPFWVRLVFILLSLPSGFGIIIYFVAALLFPKNNSTSNSESNFDFNYLFGLVLIFLASFFLISESPFIKIFNVLNLPNNFLTSIALISISIFYLWKAKSIRSSNTSKSQKDEKKKFLGVNIFLSRHLGLNINALRMLWVIFTFATIGFGIIIYLSTALIIKRMNFESKNL